jgi:hypothetical protein
MNSTFGPSANPLRIDSPIKRAESPNKVPLTSLKG